MDDRGIKNIHLHEKLMNFTIITSYCEIPQVKHIACAIDRFLMCGAKETNITVCAVACTYKEKRSAHKFTYIQVHCHDSDRLKLPNYADSINWTESIFFFRWKKGNIYR